MSHKHGTYLGGIRDLTALAAALAADAAEHARHTARHQRTTGFARALAAVGEALL